MDFWKQDVIVKFLTFFRVLKGFCFHVIDSISKLTTTKPTTTKLTTTKLTTTKLTTTNPQYFMRKITIDTTQNVSIEYELAGLADRFIAAIIDYIILFTYIFLSSICLGFIGILESNMWIGVLFLMLPYSLYHLVSEVFMEGQSLGKKQMKIKVVNLDGRQVSIGSYFLRWLFRLIDISLTFGGLALGTLIVNGKGQRLGDIAAGTIVISLQNATTLDDTLFVLTDENHEVTFPQVQSLSDKDVTLIKEVLETAKRTRHNYAILKLSDRVKKILQITGTELPSRKFLATIIKDYNHLNS